MLSLEHVVKQMGSVRAIDDLSLDVPEGMLFGLLGPNGAGKTTLLRLVMGLLRADSGRITLFGRLPPTDPAVPRLLGYMPQQLAVYPGLSVVENIAFYGHLYGIAGAELRRRTERLLEMVELTPRRKSPVGQLSGGMVRRVMLATTMVHQPRLLILDEPTAGVDPLLRLKFWEWFGDLRAKGTSIIVTTHHISEASRCHRVVFLRAGRVLEQGPPGELMARYGSADLEAAFVAATRGAESNSAAGVQ
ncbi:MAG: ABC transporter ATP-binding protein [Candidatus Lambdaproteobacteria bacterium]|nr:ABC transporter ATP-binding protein [Candidatus Lambdaproteobacteria bacterium]